LRSNLPSVPPEVQRLLGRFVETLGAAVVVTDGLGRVLYVNDAARRLEQSATAARQQVGRSIFAGLEGEAVGRVKHILATFRRDGRGTVQRRIRRGGRFLEERFFGVPGQDGRLAGMVLVCEDVTTLVHETEEALRLAKEDALTGLGNRRAFDDALARLMLFSTRQRCPLSMLFLDVDGFKTFNDRHGHPAGDAVLRQVAEVLRRSVREHVDEIYRYGGDEFVVLLPATNRNEAKAAAERVAEVFGEQGLEDIGLSIGLAVLGPDETARAFLERADRALYRAKAAGGGVIVAA
jgi:diguanylate cyclase (GGDEF)-like protein/PAS domain S-box-containing protein